MQSKAPDVPTYIAELPEERQAALKKLRMLCNKFLKGYEECMAYGLPGYKRKGNMEVAFASQKQYIALYVLKQDVVDRHRKMLTGCQIGKGCIRFRNPDAIDFEAVSSLLRDVARSSSKPC